MITLSDKQCTHPTSMTSSPSPHSSQMRTRHASMSACLKHETKEWHETRNDVFKAGLVTSTGIWIDELERRFRHTAGKATVLDDTQHNTQAPLLPSPQSPSQIITIRPPEQAAPAEQAAQAAPAAVRFEEKVDYKYDGLCSMRHRSKLIFNTVLQPLMMSTATSLIEQHAQHTPSSCHPSSRRRKNFRKSHGNYGNALPPPIMAAICTVHDRQTDGPPDERCLGAFLIARNDHITHEQQHLAHYNWTSA